MNQQVLVSEIINTFPSDISNVKGKFGLKYVKYLKPIGKEDEYTLDWVNPTNPSGQQFAEDTRAKVIICNSNIVYNEAISKQNKILIVSNNPKLLLTKIYHRYFKPKLKPEISEKAEISPDAIIGQNCHIGAFSSIGKCKIGNNVTIMPNVTIYDDVIISNNVVINSGTVLGRPGFGYEKDIDGNLYSFPQVALLIIDNNVEIGANCTIDKGALKNSIIGRDSKINNLCHIAHNVTIGESTMIAGHVNISGSTTIGNNVWISPNSTLIGHTSVGDNSFIGAGSLVTKDIPANEIWFGTPAKKQR